MNAGSAEDQRHCPHRKGEGLRAVMSILRVGVRRQIRRLDHGISVADLSHGTGIRKADCRPERADARGISSIDGPSCRRGKSAGRESTGGDEVGENGAGAKWEEGRYGRALRGNEGAAWRVFSGECGGPGRSNCDCGEDSGSAKWVGGSQAGDSATAVEVREHSNVPPDLHDCPALRIFQIGKDGLSAFKNFARARTIGLRFGDGVFGRVDELTDFGFLFVDIAEMLRAESLIHYELFLPASLIARSKIGLTEPK